MPTFSKFLNGFRGCKQVLDSDGYIYSRKKNDDTVLSSAWRCQKSKSLKCPAKCYLALTDNTLSLGSKPHNHDSDLATSQRLELLTTLKRKAAEQPLSATQNLISEVLADASTEVNQTLPNMESLGKVVQRARASASGSAQLKLPYELHPRSSPPPGQLHSIHGSHHQLYATSFKLAC